MLSEIIKNIALILDDKEVIEYLNSDKEISNAPTNLNTYITLVNFVLTNIAENFLCYKCTEELVSDDKCRLNLADLTKGICTIKKVRDDRFKPVKFRADVDYLYVGSPNKMYFVEYSYVPADLTSLDDTMLLPLGLDYKTVCYGVVCEFYTLKM